MSNPDLVWLEARLDRHGGDLDLWPAPEAARARELLLASPEARGLLEVARDLDRALEEERLTLDARLEADGRRLVARVMARLPDRAAARRGVRRIAAGMAASMLIGLALGLAVPLAEGASDDAVPVEALVFGPDELDLAE
jgi:hypothetical protein